MGLEEIRGTISKGFSMMNWLVTNLLWTEGRALVGFLAFATALAAFFYTPALYGISILFLFCFFFFRNPERVCAAAQKNEAILISPADGVIVGIDCARGQELDGYAQRVSIFLSPFDVHVNWTPCAGIVEAVAYHKGSFALAFLPKSSEKNERNDVIIKTAYGKNIKVRQIAGTIARTIVCWVHSGQGLLAGQKFGMIKFGSRVDLFLPENVQVKVTKGQRVKGGETILGHWQ